MISDSRRGRLFSVLGISILVLSVIPLCGNGCNPMFMQLTTRQQTVHPVAVPEGTPEIPPSYVPEYEVYGYSDWKMRAGEDEGRRFDLMPTGYTGSPNRARLLSFFTLSDIHITDKESPAQVLYFGWNAPFGTASLLSQAYSPVALSSTHVLNAAVKTINTLHCGTPFDFGMALGDLGNCSQYNEIRWFIDVLDGENITPSSGAHLGADTIDYQKPFQAAGLDPRIPWYAVIGNHDQYWMGVGFPTQKVRDALIGSEVLNMGTNPFDPLVTESTGMYVGVVDGTTVYGDVIKGGLASNFTTPPTVAPDENRHSVSTDDSTTAGFMEAMFDTTSTPVGHGFTQSNLDEDFACYTFEPKSDLPLKVIVLDDTCKLTSDTGGPAFYGSGWIDEERYNWLTAELQEGQDADQLMIVATHIPINPQKDLFDTEPDPQFYEDSYLTDEELIATLSNYPNLLMVIAGHRHKNTVTPQPSPDPAHPERGFWEVENSSLRDFPQQFRTFDIRRNRDNTISIFVTNVDPIVEEGTPEGKSRGYAIGAARTYGTLALDDTTSHAYNAELLKQLTPEMQTKIASRGTPLEDQTH
ncbi:MAG: TIGR03768 family metallophosphoesterase [Candidatus Hydrogenedentes bacterium]|nr:TIGR03768 family metallophosphoesterase [Candidatus Hydrogenedentota bacterium]